MNEKLIGFPFSLQVATPAEGQALACRLASELLHALPRRDGMPDHLTTTASKPAPEMVAAIYFHAIALANAGWTGVVRA